MPALAPDSLVVVIGITGYVASHIGLSTLQVGHRVRGTFRDSAKAEQLKESYARHGIDPAKLELVKLDDLTSEEQYKTAFAGVDGVVHVALASLTNPNLVEVTSEAVMAALRAAASTPTVKRFVLTATAVTAYTPGMGVKGHLYTDKDWNMPAVQAYKHATDELKSQPFYMWLRYATAKTLSELAARKWMGEKKPSFDFVSVMPYVVFGPILYGKEPLSSSGWAANLMKKDSSVPDNLPPEWFVDARDVGRLHTLALSTDDAAGKRIWAAAAPFAWNDVLAILRKHYPEVDLPEDRPTWGSCEEKIDSEYARKLLGGEWISLEQSILETVKSAGY